MSLNFKNYLNDIIIISESIENDNEPFNIETLNQLKSFTARIKYAQSKLNRIGMGSSRVVYDLGDGKVLKLARNKKGIDQNNVENDGYIQSTSIASKVYDYSPDDLWIISDKAEKITKKEFKTLTGFDFEYFVRAIYTEYKRINVNNYSPVKELPDDEMKILWENEFFQEIFDLMSSMSILPGDLAKINSWGKIKNEIVLVDIGYTESVHKQHYAKKHVL